MAVWGSGISLKGKDGSKITFITGTPTDSNASAAPGDVAFATDTNLFYQRGPSGWPTTGTLLKGGMGIAGTNAQLYVQTGAPADSLGKGDDGIYIRKDTGQLYSRDSADAGWTDSGNTLIGPAGAPGQRGTITYTGNGAPSANLASFTPPAVAGDLYYDLSAGPTLYILGN
jgi:hypothetical protein